ncbi:XkdW family protein [Pseudomonas sp.]|uniref:XkdW family protein n=1 Tax=Pseudomonas sp. TaxID=306 RepID=UPI00273472D2|nr:XkdW family protein [Pseudomonas sp.]MDP3815485.1 XkdW family protein [Pseudomonas sp.]
MRDAILHLFPGAVVGRDFTLRDDGEGPYIDQWKLPSPKPSPAQLLIAGNEALCGTLCKAIDRAADAARVAVVGAPLRDEEYKLAATEAKAFKAARYPAEAVPRTVAAWAIGGRTAQQAADNILVESAAYTEALYQIREARLGAKEMVRQAMIAGEVDQAQDIAAETIAAIESAMSGIGNSRG